MTRLRRLHDDESGMSYVFIGMGMMAFLSASMLAIDVGMLMTSRNQAQNAADAGALAGATALVFDNYDDRSAAGPSVTGAIAAAKQNDVMGVDVSVETDYAFAGSGVASAALVARYSPAAGGTFYWGAVNRAANGTLTSRTPSANVAFAAHVWLASSNEGAIGWRLGSPRLV